MITFEEYINVVNDEIRKKKHKWTLDAISWMDYEDVSQILRIHISKKWHMWDQNRPVRPWIHTIITHQISNLLRNIYGNYSRPCLKCAASEGDNLCSLFTTQCSACPIYDKWVKTKKSAYDIKLPKALEFHSNEVSERPENYIDVMKVLPHLTDKLKAVLKPIEFEVYKFLYIECKEESELGDFLGFTTSENRMKGYRQIKNIKDSILTKAKKIIYSGEIDY